MADLVTHYLVARVPTTGCRRPLQAAFVFGTILPDLLAKGLDLVLHAPAKFDVPTHSILGLAFWSYAACFLFEERDRRGAWLALWGGGLVHVLVDLLKDTGGGAASAFFLFPFWSGSYEFALYEPTGVVWSIAVAAALLILWEALARRRGRHVWE